MKAAIQEWMEQHFHDYDTATSLAEAAIIDLDLKGEDNEEEAYEIAIDFYENS